MGALTRPIGILDIGGRFLPSGQLRLYRSVRGYACGDAAPAAAQLSPVATYQGRLVGRNIVEGPNHRPDYSCIPSYVFTVPVLASVDLTQAAAEQQGIDLSVAVNGVRNGCRAALMRCRRPGRR